MNWILVVCSFLVISISHGQATVYGLIKSDQGEVLPFANVQITSLSTNEIKTNVSDDLGRFEFSNLPFGAYQLTANYIYHESIIQNIELNAELVKVDLILKDTNTLKAVDVFYDSPYGTRTMQMVDGITLTNGKKTQQIELSSTDANKSIENARELYAKVPGLNIWESDAGGLQLGIGSRGLSPSRTAHFNTRQNGYDISADALGYPETYYTPPSEALESIQLIRGAASLQFGPQFGGMINFKMKEPSAKPISYLGKHTYGAYNLINTFNSVSGTLKRRFTYLAYFQHKQGDGWRENSGFNQQNAFAQLTYYFTECMYLSVEHTYMHYLAQQAGGLTDAMFAANPRQSIRDRNWFLVDWHITALNYNWQISHKTTLDIKGFKVDAQRQALGNLEKISRVDDGKERQLIRGDFNNFGVEARYLTRYPIGRKLSGILASGIRYYQGTTTSEQGAANAGSGADFYFLNPDNLEGSSYQFPSKNIAGFVENIFRINPKFSVSAGVRFEHIRTAAEGSYREQVFHPLTNELIFDTTYFEDKSNQRSIFLGGIGFSYRKERATEFYGNIAQNYRGINFSDIRIINPNQQVDPNIADERGFNADLGVRGERKKGIFDVSVFFLYYANKIGVINQKINEYDVVRLRTNVGKAYSTGLELFGERHFWKSDSTNYFLTAFCNFSAIYAKYGKFEDVSVSQKWVELVPPVTAKVGLKFNHGKWSEALLFTYVHKHFSDGTNAEFDPNAIAGIIPSYAVLDFNLTYAINDHFNLAGGVNNLTNSMYYTRRATSYPGPGIIPSDGIGFYFSLGLSF